MTIAIEPCLVRLWNKTRSVGAGVLITDQLILTCAHVVKQALNLSAESDQLLDKPIRIDFPMIAPKQFIEAQATFAIPPQPDESGDIAILRIPPPLPSEVEPAEPFAIDNLWQIPFQTLGFPDDIGASSHGFLRSRLPVGWVELELEDNQSIESGFSGAPVFTNLQNNTNGLVGIVVAVRTRNNAQIAYMLPMTTVFDALPQDLTQQIHDYHLHRNGQLLHGETNMPEEILTVVGREAELARLQGFLDRGLNRQLAACFVSGDSGTGKTALVTEFVHRAQNTNKEIIFVSGQCNNQSGIGDPYLPFRQILAFLTGSVDDRRSNLGAQPSRTVDRLGNMLQVSGQALVEIAPDLIGTLIPGASIVASLGLFTARKAGWMRALEDRAKEADNRRPDLDQTRVFEQYTALLRKLSEQAPLVLILDDLQWADNASLALLFHLARELRESRILIIGLYRSSEVETNHAGEIHPLKKLLQEARIKDANISIDLNAATQASGRAFVDAFIDSEPNNLGNEFRQALYERTGGHALFTVELLRDLQDRGSLALDSEGRWQVIEDIDWSDLPDKVEGIIEERISRLESNLRDLLAIASVEGLEFTAQVLGRVQQMTERDLIKNLSQELSKHHRLVREAGEKRISKTILFRYAFSHAFFRQYFYNSLESIERYNFHADVAQALENLYGNNTEEIAVELAHHYTECGNVEKAIEYLEKAARRSLQISASSAAIKHLKKAIELIEDNLNLEMDKERVLTNLEYLMGEALYKLGDFNEAVNHYQHSLNLSTDTGDIKASLQANLGLGKAYNMMSQYGISKDYLKTSQGIATDLNDQRAFCEALLESVAAYRGEGDLGNALKYTDNALSLAQDLKDDLLIARSIGLFALIFFLKGEIRKAVDEYESKALIIARRLNDLYRERIYLSNLGDSYTYLGNYIEAEKYILKSLDIAKQISSKTGQAVSLLYLGRIRLFKKDYSASQTLVQQALDLSKTTNVGFRLKVCHMYLGQIALHTGNYEEVHTQLNQGDRYLIPEHQYRCEAIKAISYLKQKQKDAARLTFEAALILVEKYLEPFPLLFEPLYSKGLILAGLALTCDLTEQVILLQKASEAYQRAKENCSEIGVITYGLLLLDELIDTENGVILSDIRRTLVE